MSQSLAPFAFVLLIGVVAVLAVLGYRAEQQRRALLAQFATARGWSYERQRDEWAGYWNVTPFGYGTDRSAENVMTGQLGQVPFVAFDYSYKTSSTNSKGHRTTTTHEFVVVGVQLPAVLPSLCVTPENVLTRLGNAMGFDDVELESEDFNRRFRVSAGVPKFAYDVLHARMMEMLLTAPRPSWRIEGQWLLTWDNGKAKPADILADLDLASRIVAGIPSYVWADAAVAPPVLTAPAIPGGYYSGQPGHDPRFSG